ncbi:MAG: hypothetical protein PHU85_11510 [Phycisphaerae bacterium]|nr:hypothetical protein [Phycisphaerae bacterium]
MPQRMVYAWTVLLGVVGLLFVVVLLALGRDARKAGERGPRWWRRMMSASLLLLATCGVYSGYRLHEAAAYEEPGPAMYELRSMGLAKTPQWVKLTRTWREAEEIAAGRRGSFPFDRAGEQKLFGDLWRAAGDVGVLATAGLLTPTEAGLLTAGLRELMDRVGQFRCTEDSQSTCYEPRMMYDEQVDSAKRLADQARLLRGLAASDRVSPEVLERTLPLLEENLRRVDRKDFREFVRQSRQQLAGGSADAWVKDVMREQSVHDIEQTVAETRELIAKISAPRRTPATRAE